MCCVAYFFVLWLCASFTQIYAIFGGAVLSDFISQPFMAVITLKKLPTEVHISDAKCEEAASAALAEDKA